MNFKKKIVVIGGGPAGLAAAVEANKNGVEAGDILVLERDREPGGILNQCIHAGFGLHFFGEELTGPEYAGRFISMLRDAGISCAAGAMALDIIPGTGGARHRVIFVSPEYGYSEVETDAVILAMGCRERTRGALNIPGTRPQGVFTAGTAQRYVNIDGIIPGSRVVILGSGDIGLIMARRLTLEGAKVLRVCEIMPYSGGLARNIAQCLDDFGIPLYLSHTVTDIRGRERVEGVTVCEVDENRRPKPETAEYIECDTLLLSVGLIPENELSRGAGIELDRVTGGPCVDQDTQTSIPGIFACGNVLQVHDLVDFVTREAFGAGKAAARYAQSGGMDYDREITTKPGTGIRYIVPQKLRLGGGADKPEEIRLFFRVAQTYKNAKLRIGSDGKTLRELSKRVMTPGEMESVTLTPEEMAALRGELKVEVVENLRA